MFIMDIFLSFSLLIFIILIIGLFSVIENTFKNVFFTNKIYFRVYLCLLFIVIIFLIFIFFYYIIFFLITKVYIV